MKKIQKNKKIGLALGGGAILGAAHIGVLRAFDEFDISISFITGTSIGAFVSALYAFDKNWKEIEKIAINLNWLDVSGITLSQYGLLSNKKLGDLITETIGDVNFEKSNIPLAMVAANIFDGEKVILKKGNVAQAVMASTCIPGVFIPVEINKNLLVDGAIVENVPISPLKKMEADFIIGVDLNAKHKYKKPENVVEVLVNAFDITLINATKLQTERADILITPDLTSFNLIDPDQVPDIIEKGYLEAKKVLKEIV